MNRAKTRFLSSVFVFVVGSWPSFTLASLKPAAPRRGINLNGSWQVEQGDLDAPPASYSHTVVVPGLLDMAEPKFKDVGKKSPQRQAFWYRRTFKLP